MRNIACTLIGSRKVLVALAVILVGLHLVKSCIFVAVGQPPVEGDARHYWADADRIVSGDWLMAREEVETIRTPGYPLFLASLQLVFGHHALIAATMCQQLMVFVTAMLSAWICVRISGTWLGGLCGLALGLFCVSQNSIANRLVSDTLFGMLLTLAVAALIAWFEQPVAKTAIAVGLLMGLATLVRPVAQFAWAPILLAMAFRWSKDVDLRRLVAHGACFLVVFVAVLAPWYARNYYCCGQVFFSKTAGLTMWQSLFKSNSPLDPAVPFSDSPRSKDVLARLDGVNLQRHWDVLRALQKQGLTRMEAIDRMQEVCLDSVRAHPWKFVDSRLRRLAWFWITPNGTGRPQTLDFHLNDDRPAESARVEDPLAAADYCGQAYWRWDGYYRDGKLNWLWHPNPWLYLSTAALAGCGIAVMFRNRGQCVIATALILLLVYFAGMTAIGAPPEYRYRMILEPMLIVCIVQLRTPLARLWTRQQLPEPGACQTHQA